MPIGGLEEQPGEGVLRGRQADGGGAQLSGAEGAAGDGQRHRGGRGGHRRGLHLRQRGRCHGPRGALPVDLRLRAGPHPLHGGGGGAGPREVRGGGACQWQARPDNREAGRSAVEADQRGSVRPVSGGIRVHPQDRPLAPRGVRVHGHPQHDGGQDRRAGPAHRGGMDGRRLSVGAAPGQRVPDGAAQTGCEGDGGGGRGAQGGSGRGGGRPGPKRQLHRGARPHRQGLRHRPELLHPPVHMPRGGGARRQRGGGQELHNHEGDARSPSQLCGGQHHRGKVQSRGGDQGGQPSVRRPPGEGDGQGAVDGHRPAQARGDHGR